ncbi:CYTH domain-containing protein [Patescibacteria group bacterium]
MQIEVRVRAKIDNPEVMIQKLEEKGAYFEGSASSTSWYYGKDLFAKQDTQIRIVEYNYPEGIKKVYLTYKGPKSEEGRAEMREIFGELKRNSKIFEKLGFTERDFNTPIDAEKILEGNGMEKFAEVKISNEKKYRYGVYEVKVFHLDNANVDLIEIELNVAWPKDISKAKEDIHKLMDELGISKDKEISESGIELALKNQALSE